MAATTLASAAHRRLGHSTKEGDGIIMWLLLLEALGALCILVLIVWWTMFSGRRRDEPRQDD